MRFSAPFKTIPSPMGASPATLRAVKRGVIVRHNHKNGNYEAKETVAPYRVVAGKNATDAIINYWKAVKGEVGL